MKHGKRLFDLTAFELLKFFFSTGFPELARKLHIRVNDKNATDFFLEAFTDTLEYRSKNEIKRNDFISLLLDLKQFFTPQELAAEAFIVFAGGVSIGNIYIDNHETKVEIDSLNLVQPL